MEPPEYLELLLHDARVYGFAFEGAWPQCVERAARLSSNPAEWRSVLSATRDAWERAFENMPATAPEQALRSIGDGMRPTRDHDLESRRCKRCDRWVPTDRDPQAEFCDDTCRREFNYAIERGRDPRVPAWRDPAPWDAARAARLCEYCTTNYVPLDRERTCCTWCEDRLVAREQAAEQRQPRPAAA